MLKTKKEINEYFSHDKIQCLECGKWYLALNTHLRQSHGMTVDEYRDNHGLPYCTGLLGRLSLAKASKNGFNAWEKGDFTKDQSKKAIKKAQKSLKENRRTQEFDRNIARKKAKKASKIKKIAGIEDIKKLMNRCLSQNRTQKSVHGDSDILSQQSLMRLIRRDKKARRYYSQLREDSETKSRNDLLSQLIQIEKKIKKEGAGFHGILKNGEGMPSINKIINHSKKHKGTEIILNRIHKLIEPKMLTHKKYKIPCRECGKLFDVNYKRNWHYKKKDRDYPCNKCK